MSIQPPKIDNRTYEDIVAQTVRLVQHYTAGDSSELVDNNPENLLDRTLAQDIKDTDGKTIATAGTLIDEKLAGAIAQVNSLNQINVKVKGWYKQTIDSDPNNPKSTPPNPPLAKGGTPKSKIE
ncbi:MAG: hypothetical protein HC786_33475 [Richelia sp. CSU_2_1]|nr:hypothetical protein [Richelia sp. CSU_2_1]